jgi:preprotein translocase subunit Sec63
VSCVPLTARPDAYEVVGVQQSAPAAEIKKAYWRLSLLIHPDKCTHPGANEAFQALSRAAKELQVPFGSLGFLGIETLRRPSCLGVRFLE